MIFSDVCRDIPDILNLVPRMALFHRQAADSHEIWHHPATNRFTTIPNHPGDIPEETLRPILKQAGIEPDVFLRK